MRLWFKIMLCCAFSTVSHAASYSCQDAVLSTACLGKGWHLAIDGFYLKPMNDDLAYNHDSSDMPQHVYHVDPDTKPFAWRVEGRWYMGDNRDVTASWFHFNRNYHDQSIGQLVLIAQMNMMNGPQAIMAPQRVEAAVRFDGNVARVTVGHSYHIKQDLLFRLNFGLQYAELNHYLKRSAMTQGLAQQFVSDFKGFGPRFGIDVDKGWRYGISLVTRLGTSLLAGRIDAEVKQGQIDQLHPIMTSGRERVIVPMVDVDSVVRWQHHLKEGTVAVEAGWHYTQYLQSIHHLKVPSMIAIANQNVSNFSYKGPMVRLMFSQKNL